MWGCCSKAITVIDCHDNDINSDTLAINTQWFLHVNDMHQVIQSDMISSRSWMHFAVKKYIKKEGNVHFHSFYPQLRELCCMAEIQYQHVVNVCVSVSFTWSLEIDASHLHRVCGVMGRNVCVVQQALCPRLRLFSFATAEWPGDKKNKISYSTQGGGGWEFRQVHTHTHRSLITNICFAEAGYFHLPYKCRDYS